MCNTYQQLCANDQDFLRFWDHLLGSSWIELSLPLTTSCPSLLKPYLQSNGENSISDFTSQHSYTIFSPIDDRLILWQPEDSGLRIAILSQWGHTSHLFNHHQKHSFFDATKYLNKAKSNVSKTSCSFCPFVKARSNPNRVGEGKVPQFHLHWHGLVSQQCSVLCTSFNFFLKISLEVQSSYLL